MMSNFRVTMATLEQPVDKLCQYIQDGSLDKIWMTLVRNRSAINQKDQRGVTPLIMAVLVKRDNYVQILLEEGADPNMPCDANSSVLQQYTLGKGLGRDSLTKPLNAAILLGNPSMVRMLLHHGASTTGVSAIGVVREPEVVDMLVGSGLSASEMVQMLHSATKAGNYSTVHRLLLAGACADGQVGHMIPLLLAAEAEDMVMCRLLLKYGASLTAAVGSTKREPPMVRAVLSGSHRAVKTLMQLGASADIMTSLEYQDERLDERFHNKAIFDTLPMLHIAIMKRNLNVVRTLVEGGCDLNIVSEKCQDTCLHVACRDRDTTAINILSYLLGLPSNQGERPKVKLKPASLLKPRSLGRGITIDTGLAENPNFLNLDTRPTRGRGYGILRGGMRNEKLKVGRPVLVDKQRLVNIRNFVRQTPLQVAVAVDNIQAIRLLLKIGAGMDGVELELPGLIHRCQIDIIEMLLQAGLDIKDTLDPKGKSLLMYAAENGNLEICQLLLDAGAEIHSRTTTGDTLLHVIVAHKNPDIVQYFLKLGCGIDAVNQTGTTPLMLAARLHSPDVCQILLRGGAGINLRDQNGETALSLSVYFGEEENCTVLLQHGADPDMTDHRGSSPIYWAIFNARVLQLKQLLMCGASLSLRKFKKYPRNLKIMKDKELCKWLLDHITSPRSLQHLCRLAIRRSLAAQAGGSTVHPLIAQTPLPTKLRDYLTFSELSAMHEAVAT